MQSDGSVAFSLMELMRLEEERVAQERAVVRRKTEDAARARAEADDRQRDAEAMARHAEEARVASDYARSREEAGRIAGMQRAVMERARLEAEEAARGAERAHQLQHAEQLERIRQGSKTTGLRRMIWLMAFLGVAAAGGSFAFYKLEMAPAAARQQALADMAIRDAAENTRHAEAARDDATRRRDQLAADLEASKPAPPPPPVATTRDPVKTTLVPPKKHEKQRKHTKCNEGDPLCVDI